MRRPATVLATLLIALLPLLGLPDEARAQTGFVTWTVNHSAKTITVKAKVAVFDTPCAPTAGGAGAGGSCSTPMSDIVRQIKGDIEGIWNDAARGGRYYRCYRLIFVVDVVVVPGRSAVPGDRVAIRIDRSTQSIRSRTQAKGFTTRFTNTYLSNDPADRTEPTNEKSVPSEFAFPPVGLHEYAHEYGHILGLDEGYDRETHELVPGAPNDLMFDENHTTIAQATIDRLVERNRDRLRDRQSRPVDLDDLVCDLRYRATLKATDIDYAASNLRIEMSGPGCDPPQTITQSSSTHQSMFVTSQPVVLHVVDAPAVGFLEYSLAAVPDVLRALWGLDLQFREHATETAFAVPVTIRVSRENHQPARGARPPARTTEAGACSKGEEDRRPPPDDCGSRTFKAWMAMVQQGLDELWTSSAPVPLHLQELSLSPARDQRLYENCPGPALWPGSLVEDRGTVVTRGKLPLKAELERVAREWTADHTPGRFVIVGSAHLDTVEPGRLRDHRYVWTLTLCPMDKDGVTPPDCP